MTGNFQVRLEVKCMFISKIETNEQECIYKVAADENLTDRW